MELRFENLSSKQLANLQAFEVLRTSQFFNAALQIIWTLIREKIFEICTSNQKEFTSTEEAIFYFVQKNANKDKRQSVQRLYVLATLIEFDQNCQISPTEYYKFEKNTLEKIINITEYV